MTDQSARIIYEAQRIAEKTERRRDRKQQVPLGQIISQLQQIFDPSTGGLTPSALPSHDHTPAAGAGGVLTNDQHDGYSQYDEIGADPSTPGANTLRIYAKDKGGASTLYYISDNGTVNELPGLVSGGVGTGAPSDAAYVITAPNAALPSAALLSALIGHGALASRPAAGIAGRLWYATDTTNGHRLYRDNGSTWDLLPLNWDQITEGPTLDAITNPVADLDLDGFKVTDMADPTNPQDAATKAYVDAAAPGGSGTGSASGDHEHMLDVFAGDGAATTFELTDEPMDPEAVVAFVAGAETAVTLSGTMGTTATFGSAPGAGARVAIQYPAAVA